MTESLDLIGDRGTGETITDKSDGDSSTDTDEEVEPVELLVQLAERGEIEPWDIDIVAVTDTFLAALDDADLRASGRALFYASVLLRMKSDVLMDDSDEEEPSDGDEWEDREPWDAPTENTENGTFDALEQEMERRLERKRARGMPRTLDELVRELRERERGSQWKESRTYDTSDSPRGFTRGTQTLDYRDDDDLRMDDEPTETDVTGTTHGEDIETTIQNVSQALQEQYDRDRDEVLYAEIKTVGGSRIETFLALLFLAHRGQIRLQQDELFSDLWIQNPTQPTDETVAD